MMLTNYFDEVGDVDGVISVSSYDHQFKIISFIFQSSISFSSQQHATSPPIFPPYIRSWVGIIKSSPEGRGGGFCLWCDLGSGRPRSPARGSASGCLIIKMMLMTMKNMLIVLLFLFVCCCYHQQCIVETLQDSAHSSTRAPSLLPPGRRIVLIIVLKFWGLESKQARKLDRCNNYLQSETTNDPPTHYWLEDAIASKKKSPILKPTYVWLISCDDTDVADEGPSNDEYNHQVSLGGYRHMSYGWATPALWGQGGLGAPSAWQSKPPCSCIKKLNYLESMFFR